MARVPPLRDVVTLWTEEEVPTELVPTLVLPLVTFPTRWQLLDSARAILVGSEPGEVLRFLDVWSERTIQTPIVVVVPGRVRRRLLIEAFRRGASDALLLPITRSHVAKALDRVVENPGDAPTLEELCADAGAASLPSVMGQADLLRELWAHLQDPDSMSMGRLIDMLSRDPALVVSILKVANSSAWMSGRTVTSLRMACVRLGTVQIGAIANQVLVGSAYQLDRFGDLAASLWRNARITARGAVKIAELLGWDNPHALHSVALLHNIGEIALLAQIERKGAAESGRANFSNLVIDHLVAHHEEVGSRVLRELEAPEMIEQIAGGHHSGFSGQRAELARVCALAWECAHASGFDYPRRHHRFDIGNLCTELLLKEDRVLHLFERSRDWL